MKFSKVRFSKRFPEIECAIFVVHEPPMPKIAVPKDEFPYVENRSVHRGTAAAIILLDGRFWIGVCLCAPMDQFVKSVGRQKAVGRAYRLAVKRQFTLEDGEIEFQNNSEAAELLKQDWASRLKTTLQHEIDEAKKRVGIL